MSDKQRKKHERRQRRADKRARQQAARGVRLEAVTCPHCGDRYGTADDPDVFHRAGPCDCTPERRANMDAFLAARAAAYEEAEGGKIVCPTCGVLHGEDEQATYFFECNLVWNGCDRCFEAQAAKVEAIREKYREVWFGVKLEQPKPELVAKPQTPNKYLPLIDARPRRESIYDPENIYMGSFIKDVKKGRPY